MFKNLSRKFNILMGILMPRKTISVDVRLIAAALLNEKGIFMTLFRKDGTLHFRILPSNPLSISGAVGNWTLSLREGELSVFDDKGRSVYMSNAEKDHLITLMLKWLETAPPSQMDFTYGPSK